jgi:ADP-ribose pyrophosphatase YjhB (NUDIX family)
MTFDPKHILVATCIVMRGEQYLLTQRSLSEEKFPGWWTVPGGTVDQADYDTITPNEAGLSYNVVEGICAREVEEEAHVHIKDVRYLVSFGYTKKAGRALCLSMYATYAGGEMKPGEDTTDARWVTLAEAESMDLIEGILAELYMLEDIRAHRPTQPWAHYVKKEQEKNA